MNVTNEIRC